ncbi:MAG: MraY family glycosyltransferase [Patescibacteria group bacterium]
MEIKTILYLLAVSGGFLLTLILTPAVIRLALKFKVIDQPETNERKIHASPIPLLGGLAIFISVFVLIFLFRFYHLANFSKIPDQFLWAVFVGGLFIMIGGFLDDKFNLKPLKQIIWPTLAALVAVWAGVRIGFVTNPIGGQENSIIYLGAGAGLVLSFLWLMGMMYTTKFLDGLDGLVSGITAIACLIIFLLSLDWDVKMSATSFIALILGGSALAFLFFNWHPAKIFLGEGGSIFFGFMLGVLSIISGSKITTTLLVIGVPALDVLWVIIQRLLKRESPFSHADRKHLHFRLFDLGFSHRGAVLFFYLIALTFGSIAIFTSSFGKLIVFLALIAVMIFLILIIYFKNAAQRIRNN